MNREEKRKLRKAAQEKGISKEVVESFISMGTPLYPKKLQEGDQVKLNLKRIKSGRDYNRMQPKYRKFVDDNKDVIFTVEFDPAYGDNPCVVCLKEDPSEIKWAWWEGDLEVVNE